MSKLTSLILALALCLALPTMAQENPLPAHLSKAETNAIIDAYVADRVAITPKGKSLVLYKKTESKSPKAKTYSVKKYNNLHFIAKHAPVEGNDGQKWYVVTHEVYYFDGIQNEKFDTTFYAPVNQFTERSLNEEEQSQLLFQAFGISSIEDYSFENASPLFTLAKPIDPSHIVAERIQEAIPTGTEFIARGISNEHGMFLALYLPLDGKRARFFGLIHVDHLLNYPFASHEKEVKDWIKAEKKRLNIQQ